MSIRRAIRRLELVSLLFALSSTSAFAEVAAPTLEWQRGGCFASWCETGWYASPAVQDLDGDGQPEIIASAYSVVILDGATGNLEVRVQSGHDASESGVSNVGRTWPGIVVADVDHDGEDEIVSAHGGGVVSVYTRELLFEPGWPQQPVANELRSLAVEDLDGDGTFEIAVGAARGSKTNAWILEHTGATRIGWPQVSDGEQYSWGVYNDNIALADLNGDGSVEVIVPSDVHYVAAYDSAGSHLPASATFGSKNWGQVGIWESYATELRGWGLCDGVRAESYRTNFADGPATVADLDRDGTLEIVVTGTTYDCSQNPYQNRYHGVNVLTPDRDRYQAGVYDWTSVPVDMGAPISQDYNVIESALPNPAVADLDGDGEREILYADFAGKVHAVWLDGTEHGSWPFEVYDGGATLSFASEPVVADLDRDGQAEVLFGSWVEKGSNQSGHLYVVSSTGTLLHQVPLPLAFGGGTWNGALAAPTLADVDGDPDLEVVLQTSASGVVVYDLPGTSSARILWGTGRGSYLRAGSTGERFSDGFESGDTSRWSATP